MEKFKDFFSQKLYIRRMLVVAYFTVVSFCVFYVMLFEFDIERMAKGALGSTCMDIICMAILLILVVNLVFEKREIGLTTKLFMWLMLGTMWALFFDFLTWSLDGSLKYSNWTYVFTIASLCSGAVLAAILELYLSSYLKDVYNLKSASKHAKICVILNAAAFVLTLSLAITHSAFEFVDGHYETGVLYDVITVIPILTIIYMTGFIIRNVKIIGAHDVIAATLYIFTMVSGAIIEAVYGVGTTYVAITISDVFIFIMLQNNLIESTRKQQEELEKNVEKWRRRSNTDEVTGFLNRHAYEEEMAALKKRGLKDNFVYISMDVNGLKVVNDTLGHDAGDELIVGASLCMRRCFSAFGKLYRIGGDEFAALIYANDTELDTIMTEFNTILDEWRGVLTKRLAISCGYVKSTEKESMNLQQMAVLADKRMYIDKSNYYRKKGLDRRGQKDAHIALYELYTKILKIDIENDSYQIINMEENEQTEEMGFSPELSAWRKGFINKGMVHPQDASEFLNKTDPKFISSYFKDNHSSLRVFYRRKYDNEYRKVMLEVIPMTGDSSESSKYFLYVKDIS